MALAASKSTLVVTRVENLKADETAFFDVTCVENGSVKNPEAVHENRCVNVASL